MTICVHKVGGKDQLETAFLIPETGDSFGAAALLREGALDQIGGADAFVVQPH